MAKHDDDTRACEVGYRKPPKHTRFKKGQSGNPKGRPKGAKNVAKMVHDTLFRKITVTENGTRRSITVLEAFLKRLVKGALEGDVRSADRVLKLLLLLEAAQAAEAQAAGAGAAGAATGAADLEILRHFAELARKGELGVEGDEEEAP